MKTASVLQKYLAKPLNLVRLSEARQRKLQQDLAAHIRTISLFTAADRPPVTRLAYSEEETRALDYIRDRANALGLKTSYDELGNLRCSLEGQDPSLPRLMTGSHLDSVLAAGHFDGVVGVVSALESLSLMKELDIRPERTIELIAFRGEESTRFNRAMLGSSMLFGNLDRATLKDLKDKNMITVLDAMKAQGLAPRQLGQPYLEPSEVLAFLEVHVEQSSFLYKNSLSLGLVSIIAAPERYEITISGESSHSGTTAMDERRDPVVAGSRLVTKANQLALEALKEKQRTVVTFGQFRSEEGSMNQLAQQVKMKLDVRDTDLSTRDAIIKKIRDEARRIEKEENVNIAFKPKDKKEPVLTSPEVTELFGNIADEMTLQATTLPSMAGHDTMVFADAGIPTGMIFIQSKDGISHNPRESSEIGHITMATELLFNSIVHLAGDINS
jgi:hydantoinase/carbamoylase family amidase